MKNTQITSAAVEIKDLEKLGWEFGELYESIQAAQQVSEEEAKKRAHENMYVVIEVREDGTYYYLTDYNNRFSDSDETGDDEQTIKDLEQLEAEGKLWNVETETETL